MACFGSPRRASSTRGRIDPRSLGAFLVLWALAAPASAVGNFTRHLTITIGAGVVGGPHASFPVLVQVTDADLRTTPGGSVQSPSGPDIVFRGEDDPTCGGAGRSPCMLDHEIETYDGSAGMLLAWVRVPSLASGRVLHLYYGNSQITSSTEATGAVFDADYVGVWHLNQTDNGPWNMTRDSSRYGNHGTGGAGDAPAMTTRTNGKIGFGQNFGNGDGVYDFIDAGDDGTLNITGNQITLEAWLRHNIAPNTPHGCTNPPFPSCPGVPSETNPYGIINHKGFNDGYRLFLQGDPFQCPNPNRGAAGLTSPCLAFGVPGSSDLLYSSQYGSPATDPVTTGVWHHVAATYDNVEMKLYLDGQKLLAVGDNGNHLVKDGTCSSSVDCGTVGVGGSTVTFDQALPAGVAAGQVLTFDRREGGPVENFLILTKPDATHVTVSPAAAYDHSAVAQGSYRITSPFKTGNIPPSQAEQGVWIGAGDQPQNVGWSSEWEGDLDEVRVSRVARSASWIQTEYNNQNNPVTFYSVAGPAGVAQPLSTLTTVYRSIGTNPAVLAGSGGSDQASAVPGARVVTFGGSSLPANIGPGDQLDFTGTPAETAFVLTRDSATQVTVQAPAASAHASQAYTIKRAFNTLQAWENSLPADLVAANVREVGVAFNDGPFGAGVTFSGSVTDPARDIRLTTDLAARQRGVPNPGAGTGVVLDNGVNATPAITVLDDHVTVEYFEIKGGSGTGAHGIELANGLNPANLDTLRYNLIHNTGGDGIRVSDADTIADIYNNFIFGASNGIRLLVDLTSAARVNIFNNTVYGNSTAGITSRNAGGTRLRQTSPRVTLRNNIIHTNTVLDQDVARPFDRAYFCTGITGNDPNTCSAYVGHISEPGLDNQLTFTNATRCLYLGSNDVFRGVAVHLAVNGTGSPDMQWDYWSGAAWSSLETGPFEDYNFQYDGFAYWPDDPPGWATRLIDVDATPRYWVRVCRASGAFGTLPTESIISRADVSVASRYNLATDLTGYYASEWRGVGVTGLQDVGGTGVLFNSATDLHIQSGSVAKDAILNQPRGDGNQLSSALSQRFRLDIDLQGRPSGSCPSSGVTCWDIGADEFAPATAVRLMSFEAAPQVGAVALSWQTGSELDNLGFHLYRGLSASGPWTRLTSSLIPGLGSSPLGQSYSWVDSGLTNGVRYYYRLEDVDTASVSTFHGPVSAVPGGSTAPPPGGGGDGGGGGGGEPGEGTGPGGDGAKTSCPGWVLAAYASEASGPGASQAPPPTCTKHGDPESVSLDVVSHDASSATLELRTGGFWALHAPGGDGVLRGGGRSNSGGSSGTVRVFVPGFDFPTDPKAAALPLRRALVDAVVGKKVSLVSAEAMDLRGFGGLRPSAVGLSEMSVSRDGTVRPARRSLAPPLLTRGYSPASVARLAGTVFQGERKSAVVEITPVRFDASRQELVLAGRVRVRLAFAGVEAGEIGTGSRGRALPRRGAFLREVLAQLHTSGRGLYAVSYESLFPTRPRGFSTSFLRLQRQGEAVAFHVEPAGPVFGPGSVLYFFADRKATSTDYSGEVAYELVRTSGVAMGVTLGHPVGAPVTSSSIGFASFETNRIYQPGLLEAPDTWLWDAMVSGTPPKTKAFTLSGVASTDVGRLVVELQGGSESGVTADHHVRVSVNGVAVGEATFGGKQGYRLDAPVPTGLLREGSNELGLTNVGDTGVYSLVFLDKFSLSYSQTASVHDGVFEGVWSEGGTAEVRGLLGSPIVVDVTGAGTADAAVLPRDFRVSGATVAIADSSSHGESEAPRNDRTAPRNDTTNNIGGTSGVKWVTGFETTPGVVRFEAEVGHRYVVASREGLRSPRIGRVALSTLREGENQADYLVIGPGAFLEAATPLLERRRSEGLSSRAVSFEEIASEFGHGQPSAEAIKAFLSYAYHSWRRPSPRYVLLFGDSTDDPQRFAATSWASPLPALRTKTSYLWTASDPGLAAVNGDDELPDLAIGRLPATTVEQAETLVSKLLAWEDSGQGLSGQAVLVADNPDEAGDFEADTEDIRASFLDGRSTTTLKLRELGASTRPAILEAFDDGASLMSYVGHGGPAVWASENVLNSWDTPSLRAQSQQPFLLTMNCLNGYFVAPNYDSLSEALLKAEGRGAIAAFSPSGLSVDGPAHQYQRALVAELVSGQHERLGDAILAAQRDYAETGLMPELLAVYHLFGDPAMRLR